MNDLTSDRTDVRTLVEHLFRHRSGQMLATLTRILGPAHFELAEEVVQEAMLQALRQWPFRGIPDEPGAWLQRVAGNKALDAVRRRSVFRRKLEEIETQLRMKTGAGTSAWLPASESAVEDDQLAMIFACCHPAATPEAQVTLTLKAVGGFGVAEIARAFLAEESAIAQRLVRAKRAIREQNLSLVLPPVAELSERLDSVLQVIYLLFNDGYARHHGETLIAHELCAEAIRLGQLLLENAVTAQPKVHALLSLMLFQASRLDARVDAAGDLILLADQDRSGWDERLIHAAMRHLGQASEGAELTVYHLQAAIAAKHAEAASLDETNWPTIVDLYDQLQALSPSPIIALNRAVAIAKVRGPEAGLAELANIAGARSLRNYYLFPATQADLLRQLGRSAEAAECYRQALSHNCTEPERRFLFRRLAQCTAAPSPHG